MNLTISTVIKDVPDEEMRYASDVLWELYRRLPMASSIKAQYAYHGKLAGWEFAVTFFITGNINSDSQFTVKNNTHYSVLFTNDPSDRGRKTANDFLIAVHVEAEKKLKKKFITGREALVKIHQASQYQAHI